jgi:hypothetical protein
MVSAAELTWASSVQITSMVTLVPATPFRGVMVIPGWGGRESTTTRNCPVTFVVPHEKETDHSCGVASAFTLACAP